MTQKMFHERFAIAFTSDIARARFINRIDNELFSLPMISSMSRELVVKHVATALGQVFTRGKPLRNYVSNDFILCLQAIEAIYECFTKLGINDQSIDLRVTSCLSRAEADLGVVWKDGKFLPSGAQVLDDALVNSQLRWLSEPRYENVLRPFEKALRHFLESHKREELLADAVTDAYEALEAMAKLVTNRDKDVSGNAELFLSKVGSTSYIPLLKAYISYANEFRHAADKAEPKPKAYRQEVESFLYLTGIFLRLAQGLI